MDTRTDSHEHLGRDGAGPGLVADVVETTAAADPAPTGYATSPTLAPSGDHPHGAPASTAPTGSTASTTSPTLASTGAHPHGTPEGADQTPPTTGGTSDANRVCVVGAVFLDVVMGGLEHAPRPGEEQWVPECALTPGGAANLAVAAARLDLPVSLVAYLGSDAAGRLVEDMLLQEGLALDGAVRTERQSVSTCLFFDGDRAITTFGVDAAPPLPDGPAPGALLADLGSIGSNLDVVRAWRAGSHPTWVLGDVAWDPTGTWDPMDLEPLAVVDAFTPNDGEALRYTRTDSVADAARLLATRVGTVVVTCGAQGVVALGEEEVRLGAPTVRAVDTTGAGDTFAAALAWAHLHGLGLRAAVSAAVLAATLTVTTPGGASSAPTLDKVAAFARSRLSELQGYDLTFLDLL